MNYLLTLILSKLILLLAFNPLQANQKSVFTQNLHNAAITKVTYSATGGRGGNTVSLEITAGNLVYVQGHAGAEKTIKERTSRSLWLSLVRSINVKDLDRIKSNPGHAMYDGTDITIAVLKGREEHSIVNGSEDILNYKKIKLFTDILEGQLTRLGKRIRW